MTNKEIRVAVLLPCYNEGAAISKVVLDFKQSLPNADIYVFNNNSMDDTSLKAQSAGAIIYNEPLQGKGHVIRSMFVNIEADVYLLADGDGTYDASCAPMLVDEIILNHKDMVIASRIESYHSTAHRYGHLWGNKVISKLISLFYRRKLSDVLSGYRALSRRLVKSSPVLIGGFEVETRLTIHALEIYASIDEIEVQYYDRVEGTQSKLHTYKDGFIILWTIFHLFKESKPFLFFLILSILFGVSSLGFGIPIIFEFLETGLVPRVSTAILSTGLAIISVISLTSGIILNSLSHSRIEIKRILFQVVQ